MRLAIALAFWVASILVTHAQGPAALRPNPPAPQPLAPATPALTQVQILCRMLCGGVWQVTIPQADGLKLTVTYVYELDELQSLLSGRGYFSPPKGPSWVDRHFYMTDATTGRLHYVGISPRAGITQGEAKIDPRGFTVTAGAAPRPFQLARMVHEFPNADTHHITIFQSEDGFRAPAKPIILKRSRN